MTNVLISNNSAASSRVPVLGLDFTSGAANDVAISDLKFSHIGLSDGVIAGAYLISNDIVITPYSSISHGIIDFTNLHITVPAGETKTLWLAIDPATGLPSGNQIAFELLKMTDITATDASHTLIYADGIFPIIGNNFSITSVSNPD